ncbi:MAG TPA: hypothetical protein VMP01_07905 [Pirellulaceae bacterium]|nr:hypothetical protein [Pirellulaceae bacterium]
MIAFHGNEVLLAWPEGGELAEVPLESIGEALAVRITESELIIYGPDLAVIACHPLLPRTTTAARSEQPAHRPREELTNAISSSIIRQASSR